MTKSDGQILLLLGVGVLLLAVATEMASRRGWLPQWLARKLLHIGAVGACALAPLWLQDLTVLRWIVALVLPVLLYLVATGRLFSEANGRRSWGIVLFPLAYLLLIIFAQERFFIVVPMGILALSDAMAAIVGQLFARRFFQLTGDRKSLLGSGAFLVTALLVVWASQYFFPEQRMVYVRLPSEQVGMGLDGPWQWAVLIFVLLLLTVLESLGSNGWDNLLIPLGAAFLLQKMAQLISHEEVIVLWIAVFASGAFAWFTIRRRSLTLDGAVTAAFIGLWVLFFPGPVWLWALVLFFGSSVLLGRLPRSQSIVSDVKHGKPRDYRQVLCNGGVYALLATFTTGMDVLVFVAMASSLAVSTADTWASEIGTYFQGRTYDIWRWRPTPVGLSGGVSWAGTLGGLVGAAVMAQGGFLFLFSSGNRLMASIVTVAGFAGMLLDSVLGATLQARYHDEKTGDFTDIPTSILHSGYRWMSNDAVNLLSNVLIVLVVWGVLFFWSF